jgi:hypothetical protein
VEIRQFWMEKLTEVPSPSIPIAQAPPMKKMNTEGAKKKFLNPKKNCWSCIKVIYVLYFFSLDML